MSIMSMFSNAFGAGSQPTTQPAAQTQTPGAGNPGNIPTGAANNNGANPQVPPEQQAALQTPATPVGPLAEFADLWQPVETNSSNPASGILGNIDPQKVMEAAGKTDFSKVVNQDTMAKIQAGGPEAMQAMMEAMNRMAQTVYGQAAIATSKMVEQAATKMDARFKSELPNEFKRLNVGENLRDSNPIFSNPAIAPLVSAMEQQFTVKYPNASSAEITKLAKDYIAGVGSAFSPAAAPTQAEKNASARDTDWSTFLQ